MRLFTQDQSLSSSLRLVLEVTNTALVGVDGVSHEEVVDGCRVVNVWCHESCGYVSAVINSTSNKKFRGIQMTHNNFQRFKLVITEVQLQVIVFKNSYPFFRGLMQLEHSVTRLSDLLDFGPLLKPLVTINLPKSSSFLGNFRKGVTTYHCSSEIIFGQLLQTFGDFFLVTLLEHLVYVGTNGLGTCKNAMWHILSTVKFRYDPDVPHLNLS